jgi:D-alanyl-D-alanine carboxypeptidase (penicillin-binding protein 5/6)
MMNQKARQLGCKRSNFIRASGLPAKKQYSTAYDLALIMREAQRVPFIASTLRVKTTAITSLDGRRIPLKNHNKLLMRGHNQIIGKTGWTRRARHCFVGQITSSNRTAVVAILGSRSPWKDLKTLIRYQSGRSVSLARRHTPSYNPADIRKLQIALKRAGFYGGPVSGKYGPLTRSAVESFQKAHGLTADGIYGPQTRRAVRPYCFLARFNTRKLQTALQHSGFYEGPISGQYGPLTRAAVKKFQAANGLQRDGICGPQTLQAIRPKL